MTIQTPIEYNVYDWEGNTNQATTLNVSVSESTAKYIVHRALIKEQNNQRSRTACTKTRSEVRGGGRKPWKQKGTGRARAGSTRSPLWKGGGVIFGPRSLKSNIKMNRKEWRLALKTVIYNRSQDIKVIENFTSQFNLPKTKNFIQTLKQWNISPTKKTLLVTETSNNNLLLSIRNIPNLKVVSVNNLNVTEVLKAYSVIITVDALSKIQEVVRFD
uniref:ribosomal protein L4 n=1 Tax=Timspurckia oligopyrenoides TaxID=708627 RepID=UPI001FCD41C2|nr:ribosomal protein L4 [Timspurckia oligopyrenoides]UNJ17543.1 ribosomal protein L4 [Timspurckia oligopyrenoides]